MPAASTGSAPEPAAGPALQRGVPTPQSGPGSLRSAALFAVDEPWIGALIPKRWARRAVTRNAIRRQIYAVSSDPTCLLSHAAHVVRLRSAFDKKKYPSASSAALKQAVRGELQQLFARAQQ
jgi:ribonuclease P protein component